MTDYKKYFAIKRALKSGKDITYNDRRVAWVHLSSVTVLAGVTYLYIRHEGDTEAIYADIQQIKIITKS
jgi:hypothetical protein